VKARRDYSDYLRDILDAVEKIQRFTQGMTFAQFASDDKTVFAAIRGLEIIGEAAKRLPRSLRDRCPQVPWRAITGIATCSPTTISV
jgi:uncharacterized protein with HEPN domain